MLNANLISAESWAIDQLVLLPWCVCVTLDEWELTLATKEGGNILWIYNLKELVMVLAANHDNLLSLLLIEESLDEGPSCFERSRGIDDDSHRHALWIIVRRNLHYLPK